MLEFLKAAFLVLHFFNYVLMTFLMILSVVLLSMLMILLSIIHDQASYLWQQLEVASKLESYLWDTVKAGSCLLISKLEKLDWFHLTILITLVLLVWKWLGLFLMKNNLLRFRGWLFLLNWIGAYTLPLLSKVPLREFEPCFVLWNFFLSRLLCISLNLSFGHARITVVMSGLVLLAAAWNC